MRISPLFIVALAALASACNDTSSAEGRQPGEHGDHKTEEVRLSRDLRNEITWDSHPTEVFDSTWEFYGGKRKPKPEVQKFTRRSGERKLHLSARARAESSTSDAKRYFRGQSDKYLKPESHTRKELPGLGDEAILGLSTTGGNNHLFVRVGPIFLEVRSKEPAETLQTCAKAYAKAMTASLGKHLD